MRGFLSRFQTILEDELYHKTVQQADSVGLFDSL